VFYFCITELILCDCSLVPRPHPRGEEKGSSYNTTFCPTPEGCNQIPLQVTTCLHMRYMVYHQCHVGPHCGAYYSNCAVIGHSTCQTALSLGRVGCRNQTLFLSRRVGSGHETSV